MTDPEIKELLLAAVPQLPEPEDRIGQVRARVRRARRRNGAVVTAAVVAVAAVSLAVPQVVGGDPVEEAATPPDDGLRAFCDGIEFDTVPADWSAWPPLGDLADEVDFTHIDQEPFDGYEWLVAEQTGDSLALFGVPGGVQGEAAALSRSAYAEAHFERRGDRWVPQSWGQCWIEVSAPDWGNARFVLDPEAAPDPTSSTVSVLAWEMACASGQPPDGRAVEARVLAADEQSVSIVVLVEPTPGNAECPSNPSFPLEVNLGEPLGDRVLLDASADPPFVRPWPPSQASLDSFGFEE